MYVFFLGKQWIALFGWDKIIGSMHTVPSAALLQTTASLSSQLSQSHDLGRTGTPVKAKWSHFVAISLSWIDLLETKPYGALLYVILAIQWLWFLDHKLFCDYTCVELWTDTWQPQWSLQAGEGASLRLIYVPIRIKLQAHFRIPRWYGGAVTSFGEWHKRWERGVEGGQMEEVRVLLAEVSVEMAESWHWRYRASTAGIQRMRRMLDCRGRPG